MNDKKRLNSYEDLPLVLDVADIQRIMGISRASAYELVHTPGFPAFRRGRLIKVSKIAFFEWMAKAPKPYQEATNKREVSFPDLQYCRTFQRGIQREKNLKMIPRRYIKTAYLRTSDRNGERSRLWQE